LPILDLKPSLGIQKITNPNNLERLSLGSISRPEKICDEIYNKFIADALKRHPNLDYLYTGRESALEIIPLEIRKNPRCISLGWVDPVRAIANFSIYLEPFPWGGGEMTLLAMQAGLPYLTLVTEENKLFGIYGFIERIAYRGDPLLQYSFCSTHIELTQRLDKLIEDHELRLKLGDAWRQAVEDFQPHSLESWRRLFND
jgi:glycosyltransferase involved in cell wall biosynthesis